jgi:cation diffusion facilitator family transporter
LKAIAISAIAKFSFMTATENKNDIHHHPDEHKHEHDHKHGHHDLEELHHRAIHEKKTRYVVIITAVVMFAEIFFGYYTNSMSLLADGWHMASHVLAIGMTWFAYVFIRKHANETNFPSGTNKILSLSGYTSAIFLLIIAFVMASESIERLAAPVEIRFEEAIVVAFIGLIVNLICAGILHHDHSHSDHNIKAAYLHVLADALTSITAIIALVSGWLWNLYFLDSLSAIISSLVILNWAIRLAFRAGKDLIGYKANKAAH